MTEALRTPTADHAGSCVARSPLAAQNECASQRRLGLRPTAGPCGKGLPGAGPVIPSNSEKERVRRNHSKHHTDVANARRMAQVGEDGGHLTWQSSPFVLWWLHRLQMQAAA